MSRIIHRTGSLSFGQRLAMTFAAALVILTAWGSALALFTAAIIALGFLWLADCIHHHRTLVLIAFIVAVVVAIRSVS